MKSRNLPIKDMESPLTIAKILSNSDKKVLKEYKQSISPERMEQWLNSTNWKIRNAAVKIIELLRLVEFSGKLIEFTADRTPASLLDRILGGDYYQTGFIRRNAISALGEFGECSEGIENALLMALRDPYWEVRSAAVKAAKKIYSDFPDSLLESFKLLFREEKEFEVLMEMIITSGELAASEDILLEIRPFYNNPNSRVKTAIVGTLKKLHARGVIKDKETLLKEISNIFIPGIYHNQ